MKYYRVGAKQNRAILDEEGKQVALFEPGQEELATKTCDLLNGNGIFQDEILIRQPATVDLVVAVLGELNTVYEGRLKIESALTGTQQWLSICILKPNID